MDYEVTTRAVLEEDFDPPGTGRSMDDMLYMLFGDSDPASMLVMIFAISLFAISPVLLLLLFGYYSGGMRWLIALGVTTTAGLGMLYMLRRGTGAVRADVGQATGETEFRGELTRLAEAVGRGADGYAYSQMQVRERVCELLMRKLRSMRGLSLDEMHARLDAGDLEFVGDEVLASFLAENRRGAQDWERLRRGGKRGRSKERGRRFVSELEDILDRTEALT